MSTSQGFSGTASGGQLEEKVDLSSETTDKIAQAQQLASSAQLAEALSLLAALEKRCRVGNDNASLVRVCETSLQICYDAGDVDALIATLETLANRRSQKTSAVKALVQTAKPWCMNEPYQPLEVNTDEERQARDRIVVALREITEGKIFLEKERAQLTRVLATIKEQAGNVAQAADILQDVHVETYGSLSKREKVEFILEQMRLTLAKKDFVRAAIVAGKVSRKQLLEENMQEYKTQFYQLMTVYHRQEKDALELAKDYHAIYSTPNILQDQHQWMPALQATVLFLVLAPYGNEQQDMLHRISRDSNMEKLPAFHETIKIMLKKEIVQYPLPQQAELEGLDVFATEGLASYWRETFHRRIVQHNIRIASLYYKRIHLSRLAQLLQLDKEKLENEIASMVSDGVVYAKMDRPQDLVRFAPPQTPETILTEWVEDIDELLKLVETTTHLIQKENMTKVS